MESRIARELKREGTLWVETQAPAGNWVRRIRYLLSNPGGYGGALVDARRAKHYYEERGETARIVECWYREVR